MSTPPGNSLTVAAKSSTEQAVKGPLSMSTVFTKLGGVVLLGAPEAEVNKNHPSDDYLPLA